MKFALVNDEKVEAKKGTKGFCPSCGSELIAKCGEVKIHHWAHKGNRNCDPWWENETEWHRAWKGRFPVDWQEVVQLADDGEKHIADVKTDQGWVFEFQHSYIQPLERRLREAFYTSMIWVVDGKRRERDEGHFLKALQASELFNPLSHKRRISTDKGALLRDWAGSRCHVFFDFGDEQTVWWLWPSSGDLRAWVQPLSREQLVRGHRAMCSEGASKFDSLVQNFYAFITHYESPAIPPPPGPQQRTHVSLKQTSVRNIHRRFRF